jgi:putative aldouronate transport system substrate-binding protein
MKAKKVLACLALVFGATTTGVLLGTQAQNSPVDLSLYFTPGTPEVPDPPENWFVYKILREKFNINLKINRAQFGAEGTAKLRALAAANDLPDYFAIDDRTVFYDFAEQGLLAPSEPIQKLMPKRFADRSKDSKLVQLSTFNNVRYGFIERSIFKNRHGMLIRKDWLTKLGLKAPTTLEEFLEVAKAFTFNDPDGNGKNDTYGYGVSGSVSNYAPGAGLGVATSNSSGWEWVYGAYGVGSRWNITTAGAKPNVLDSRYLQATQFIRKVNQAKIVDPDWPTLSGSDFAGRWKAGKYGMFLYDFCAAICYQNYPDFDKNNPKGELQYIFPPKGPGGKSSIGLLAPVGTLMAMSKRAADAGKGKLLAQFLEWANSPEGYFALMFGIKGVNYNLDKDGDPTYEGIPENMRYTSKEQGPLTQMKNFASNGNPGEVATVRPPHKALDGRIINPIEMGYKITAQMPFVNTTAQLLIKPANNQADLDRYIAEGLTQFVLGATLNGRALPRA